MCGFEKGVSELHIIVGWSAVVEHVRHSIALISKFQRFKMPVSIKDKLLLEHDQVNIRIRDKNHQLPKIKTEMGRQTFIF